MNEMLLVSRDLTEAQEAAFWDAWEQYQKWKRDEVFPRPILPAHLWDALIKAAIPKSDAKINLGGDPDAIVEDDEPQIGRDYA